MNLLKLCLLCSSGLDPVVHFRMLQAYQSVSRSVSTFCGVPSPDIRTVYTKSFLRCYEDHLTLCGLKRNTTSFYMTTLRSLYNSALALNKVSFIPGLFADVFTGCDPTEKRAVGPDVIARIESADLSGTSRLERCRDYFMLCFYLQGMPFIDLAYLKKSDVQGNVILYRRHKTSSVITVTVHGPARDLLDKYLSETSSDSPYALPLLTEVGVAGRAQYETVLRRQNRQLKSLGAYIGLEATLTSYVARHSWATIAYHNNVGVSLVSQALGHHTEEVTRTYLGSFARERLSEANEIVLRAIRRPIETGEVVPFVNPHKESGRLSAVEPMPAGSNKKMIAKKSRRGSCSIKRKNVRLL